MGAAAPPPAANRLRRLRTAAVAAAIFACLPYAALKVAWLTGSSVGSATALGAASLHDDRHSVGNAATLAMELVAVMLALALGHRRGLRLPAAVVVIPMWVGTGLLAPIALGLPLGITAQAIVGGSPAPADNGLHGWVYAVVYGGFVVQAVALLTAFVLYARVRWAELLRLRRLQPAPGPTPRRLAGAGAVAAVVYAVANLAWAVAGDWLAAPPGFDTAAQKSLLVSTAILALAGAFAARRLVHPRSIRPLSDSGRFRATLALGWVGSATTFASGLSMYALAADASPNPSTSLLLALGTISGVMMGLAALLAIAGAPKRDPSRTYRVAGGRGSGSPRATMTRHAGMPICSARSAIAASSSSRERAGAEAAVSARPGTAARSNHAVGPSPAPTSVADIGDFSA